MLKNINNRTKIYLKINNRANVLYKNACLLSSFSSLLSTIKRKHFLATPLFSEVFFAAFR